MDELVKVVEDDGKQAVSARDLHTALEVKRNFSGWIKNRIEKYRFVEGEDYRLVKFGDVVNRPQGGGKIGDAYFLTLDTAKEIAIVESNEKGREIRQYLIKVEEAWNRPEMIVHRAAQVIRGTTKPYVKNVGPASYAAGKVNDLQNKYKYTEKVSKEDVAKLFECSVALKHYFYRAVMISDTLEIRRDALEKKLLRTCHRLGISKDDVPTRKSWDKAEWPDFPELKALGQALVQDSDLDSDLDMEMLPLLGVKLLEVK
jgi:phage anti-repressor protein